jgi:hypothetical protein
MLHDINAHPRDAFIEFDEPTHIYTIHGAKGYTSVTTFVHHHFESFDADRVVAKMMTGRNMRDETYKYYGMTAEEIKAQWAANGTAASAAGTKMHYDIECFYNGLGDNGNDSVEFGYFRAFAADHPHLVAYRTEWMIYYEEYRICGSVDMVFFNTKTGKYCIYDWKRVRNIEFEGFGGRKAHTPCVSHLPDCNFFTYSLQLNMYRALLEAKYGLQIDDLVLVVLHPENAEYVTVECVDLRAEVAALLEHKRAADVEGADAANNTH